MTDTDYYNGKVTKATPAQERYADARAEKDAG
jgi:hypothetical protein